MSSRFYGGFGLAAGGGKCEDGFLLRFNAGKSTGRVQILLERLTLVKNKDSLPLQEMGPLSERMLSADIFRKHDFLWSTPRLLDPLPGKDFSTDYPYFA